MSSSIGTASDCEVHLRMLYQDCETAGNRCIEAAHQFQWLARAATVYSIGAASACVPLLTWQLRKTDRVWRIRHPLKVQNYRWLTLVLGSSSVGVVVFLGSSFGFLAAHAKHHQNCRDFDSIGWEALVTADRLKNSSIALLEGESSKDDLYKRLNTLKEG
jgi:hypothetical protein